MFTTLYGLFNSVVDGLSGGNAMAKGLVTVWALTVLGYVCKKVPAKIMHFLMGQFSVSIDFVKDSNPKNASTFAYIEHWLLQNSRFVNRNRSHSVNHDDEELYGFSMGSHLVVVGWRPYFIYKDKSNQSTQGDLIYNLRVMTIGRDLSTLESIVEDSLIRDDVRYYYATNPDQWRTCWKRMAEMTPTPNIFLDKELKEKIDKHIIFFRDNKQWYLERNLPYKLTIVLYGEPGTGKSTIIRYISDLVNSDLYSMNMNGLPADRFEGAMRSFRKGVMGVVAIEDFEQHGKRRQPLYIGKEPIKEDKDDEYAKPKTNLDIFLNVLQGVFPLDNVITIMSTNFIDQVDPAVIRKDRTDLLLEVKALGLSEVQEFFEFNYRQPFPSDIKQIKPIKACDMSGLFKDYPFEPEEYVKHIRENYWIRQEGSLHLVAPRCDVIL